MKERTVEEKLYKGYIREKKQNRRAYAISEIKKLHKDDLLEIKYQYEVDLAPSVAWTWVIALFGAVLALLSSDVENWISLLLFSVTIVGAGIIALKLHYVMAVQRYLLCRVEERLKELSEAEKYKEKEFLHDDKQDHREIINLIKCMEEKERIKVREQTVKKMLEDGVLSDEKIADYNDMSVEQIQKYIES